MAEKFIFAIKIMAYDVDFIIQYSRVGSLFCPPFRKSKVNDLVGRKDCPPYRAVKIFRRRNVTTVKK